MYLWPCGYGAAFSYLHLNRDSAKCLEDTMLSGRSSRPWMDNPVQWISEAENIALPVVDLSNLSDEQQRVFALRLSAENAGRSFDLGTDTLLRTYLLKLKENDHVLLAAFHHIATDGWSMAIFNSGNPGPL